MAVVAPKAQMARRNSGDFWSGGTHAPDGAAVKITPTIKEAVANRVSRQTISSEPQTISATLTKGLAHAARACRRPQPVDAVTAALDRERRIIEAAYTDATSISRAGKRQKTAPATHAIRRS